MIVTGVCRQDFSKIVLSSKTELLLSPNPAGDEQTINITTKEVGKFVLSVYSVQGIKLKSFEFEKTGTKLKQITQILELNDLRTGIYQYILKTPSEVITKEVVVVR